MFKINKYLTRNNFVYPYILNAIPRPSVRPSVCNRAQFGKYCGKTIRLTKLKFCTHLYKTLLHIEFEGF